MLLLTTHLAESREEMQMFRDGSGPLYEFMENIGRDMGDCGHETPLDACSKARSSMRRTRPDRQRLDRRAPKRIDRKRLRVA